MKKGFKVWIGIVLGLEIVSALTIFQPVWNSVAAFVVACVVGILAWKRPTIAAAFLVLELLIGSKGYLLQFGDWPVTVSLRMLITAAFLLGWSVNLVQNKGVKDLVALMKTRRAYLALAALIVFASIRGYFLGNKFLVNDANAWMDLVLLLPVLDISSRFKDRIRRDVLPVLVVGILWLAVKTLGLEYVFSHGFKSLSQPAYLWVRRTGVGEVTLMMANAFRIFMQSYVYAMAAWLAAFCFWASRPTGRASKATWWMMAASTSVLAISLSRSLWIGLFFGGICSVILLHRTNVQWWKRLAGPITASVVGLFAVVAVMSFPLPSVEYASLKDLFGARADLGEAAAKSRWSLFPIMGEKIMEHPILGSGFGATISYRSYDPRAVIESSGALYTTYAFEWGWVDHWIKFGVLGIPVMAWVLISLIRRSWATKEAPWFRVSIVASLVALACLHFFTPYLNHPLGFLFLFLGEGLIITSKID